MTADRPPPALTGPFVDRGVISLPELLAAPDLQTRYDTKYVVRADVLERVAEALDGGMRILEVDGRRAVGYRTTYFDTPDLVTYRMHVQRRRRRYKVRTRTYLGQLGTVLEVKTKDKAGRTIKHRTPHPGDRPDEMPADALAFVTRTLEEAYGFPLPDALRPSATTRYWRTTLLDRDAGERLTVDLGLAAEMDGRERVFGDGHVLLEIKAPARSGRIERTLRGLDIRPLSVSKYCVAVAALQPHRPGNRWRPAMRRLCAQTARGGTSVPANAGPGAEPSSSPVPV